MKLFLTTGLLVAASTTAHAAQVYFNDFEGGVGLDGAGAIESVQGYEAAEGFSGSFWRNDVIGSPSTLSLTDLPAHTEATVQFKLALIDSWDGGQPLTCCGGDVIAPDFFNFFADGVEIIRTSLFDPLSSELAGQQTGDGGFNPEFDDDAFRVSVTFAHSADTLDLSFFGDGEGYQGGIDESWAIDRLRVKLNEVEVEEPGVVPLPGTLPLMAGALGLGLFGLRRRKS